MSNQRKIGLGEGMTPTTPNKRHARSPCQQAEDDCLESRETTRTGGADLGGHLTYPQ
jgi:hypothetical protein